MNRRSFATGAVFAVAIIASLSSRAEDPTEWKKTEAGQALDARCKQWFEYSTADRGQGATKTSCVCCHTVVPFALARPAVRKAAGEAEPNELEKKLLAQIRLRVEGWADLDTPAYRLMYWSTEAKKKQSRGTEAVLNALVLSANDRNRGATSPGEVTKTAFVHLWATQIPDGANKGSWDWLDFGLEPWESKGARYYGAALAAVAIATAPGYYTAGGDAVLDAKVNLLRGYLKSQFDSQPIYNRVWALWATIALDGILTQTQRSDLIAELFNKQRADGGWSLSALGTYVRRDDTPQVVDSDGYASGLILHVLQIGGYSTGDSKVAKGLKWLRANQAITGEWKAHSLNEDRDLSTHEGKFMSDAATAFAVLALSH